MYDQSDIEKLDILIMHLKGYRQAIESYRKASATAYNGGVLIPRTGKRGGRATTVTARLERCAEHLHYCEEKIKLSDKDIGML